MNYKPFLLILLLTVIGVGLAHATTDTIGGSTSINLCGGSCIVATAITASSTGVLNTLGINMSSTWPGGTWAIGIYTDNSANPGTPGNLIANSINITNATPGWNDVTIPGSVSITSGTHYWIVFMDSGGDPSYYKTGSDAVVGPGITFVGDWPTYNPFPVSYSDFGATSNERMIYCPAGQDCISVTIAPTMSRRYIPQSQIWTATITGTSSSPFTYNWNVYNSVGALVYNALYNGVGFTNSITYTPTMLGNYFANVIVTDTSANSVNSIQSELMVVPINITSCVNGIPTNMVSGVLFQNSNTVPLTIYADSYNPITGYYNYSTNMGGEIVNQTAYGSPYNASTSLNFMPSYYGMWNFTNPTNFHCQWWPPSGSSSSAGVSATNTFLTVNIPEHILFILFFIAAIALIIMFFIILPGDLKTLSLRPLFLLLLIIAFWIGTVPALLALENTISVSYPTYNVIQGSQITQFPSYTVNAISTMSVKTYNAYFYIWFGILLFLFFMLLFWYLMLLRSRAAQLLKSGRDVMEELNNRKV